MTSLDIVVSGGGAVEAGTDDCISGGRSWPRRGKEKSINSSTSMMSLSGRSSLSASCSLIRLNLYPCPIFLRKTYTTYNFISNSFGRVRSGFIYRYIKESKYSSNKVMVRKGTGTRTMNTKYMTNKSVPKINRASPKDIINQGNIIIKTLIRMTWSRGNYSLKNTKQNLRL